MPDVPVPSQQAAVSEQGNGAWVGKHTHAQQAVGRSCFWNERQTERVLREVGNDGQAAGDWFWCVVDENSQ